MSRKGSNKRTLIVAGNCQGSFLQKALLESPELSDTYDIIYFRNFRKQDQGVLKPRHMAQCAILLEQIAHQAPELPNKEFAPTDCKIITFPILWMNSLWPSMIDDPRNRPLPGWPAGPFPYGDRFMLNLLQQGMTPAKAVDHYFELDLSAKVDLDRFHEINVAKAEQLDARADVPLGKYVFDSFRQSNLFVTRNHPSISMLHHIRDRIFEALGVKPPESDLLLASGGMGQIHVPIHPSVAEHFGLEWYSPDYLYSYFGEQLTAREYFMRYAAFE